jgi:hypothetical protein
MVLALAAAGCSPSSATPGGGDGGEDAGQCGPAPETLAVTGDDCVAAAPNPCCPGFTLFSCSGDAGTSCSETSSCVRAARYDQSVCNGGLAYSCPELNGTSVYASLTTPGCVQVDMVPQNGEGLRWCCGGNGVTIPVPDASVDDDGGAMPDAGPSSDSGGSADTGGTVVDDAGAD